MESTNFANNEESEIPKGSLGHLRILDLSRIFAGPWATQLLADMGAEVIKVERPAVGDDARRLGPVFAEDETGAPLSSFFSSTNRNKKSITINLADPEGQGLVRKLARQSDVVVENYRTGTLKKYGLHYEALAEENERLVYCSITGFGQTGPYKHRPGYDLIFQAMSGLMSITGNPENAHGHPQRVGIVVSDLITGMYSATSILAALQYRDKVSGRGQYIDLALLDCQIAGLSHVATSYLFSGEIPQRYGTAAPSGAPSQMYRCRDGDIVIVVGNEGQFRRFCEVLHLHDIPGDERFKSNALRLENINALNDYIEAAIANRNLQELLSHLENASVPAAPVLNIQQMTQDPHVNHRDMVVSETNSSDAASRQIANPIRFSNTPIRTYDAPPALGQNNREVFSEILGFTEQDIALLHQRGVI